MAEKATNMTGTPFPDKETELTISDMTDEQLAELAPWSEKLQSIKNRM